MENRLMITKLNGSNYQLWKYKMELLLLREELWDTVIGTPPTPVTEEWKSKDGKARATIGLLIEDNQVIHIRNSKTAKETWDGLKKYHEKSTLSNKVFLLKRLCKSNMIEGGNMEEHISMMMDIVNQLISLGQEISDNLLVAFLLSSLPESYEALVTTLEARPEAEITIEMVKEKLIQEYRRRKEMGLISSEENPVAMKITSKIRTNNEDSKPVKYCHFCKKANHFKKDCYFYKRQLRKVNMVKTGTATNHTGETNNPDNDFCFNITDKSPAVGWYIDSGASSHITCDRSFFDTFSSFKTEIQLADGHKAISYGSGNGFIQCLDGNDKPIRIRIENVLYVPSLETSLLSVKRLAERGYDIQFSNTRCEIKKNNLTIAYGQIENNLYKLAYVNRVLGTWERSDGCCIHVWHRRFGHRDPQIIKQIIDNKLLDGITLRNCNMKMSCETCALGKMTRSPFPQKSSTKSKSVMDLVHSDVCGPMQTETPSGNRYILTLIDDFSRYTTVYLLKRKDEVHDKIKDYIHLVQNKFGKKPKLLRSDRGGEYMALYVKDYLKEQGIEHQTSAPKTPQQNGIAERKNRDLMNMARCMLIDAELPNKYWGEAVMTANYSSNIILTRSTNKIPVEVWNGQKANVSHIRIFGSTVFMHNPDDTRRKLDPKARKLTFVGYAEGSKAYRLLDRSTGKIFISRDVKFIENFHHGLISRSTNDEIPNDTQSKNQLEEAINERDKEVEIHLSDTKSNSHTKPTENINNVEEDDIADFYDAIESPGRTEELPEHVEEVQEKRKSLRINKGIPPARHQDYFNKQRDHGRLEEPTTVKEALESPNSNKWKIAMDQEMEAMLKNQTWDLVELPPDKKPIGSKWIFKTKTDSEGNVTKYKARIVARGFTQKFGEDYDAIFAPVVKQSTIRLVLAIAGMRRLSVFHYDFKTAFLNSDIDTELYMKQPDGYVSSSEEKLVCKLKKCIYGLKQAANLWNQTIHGFLQELGFRRGEYDQCLYIKNSKDVIYILIYVDDMLLVSKSMDLIEETVSEFQTKFEMSCLGEVSVFLGMEITKDCDGFYSIRQKKHISKLLRRFAMENAKPSKLPMDTGFVKCDNSSDELFDNEQLYQQAIGELLYLSVNSRPDIAVATSILGRRVVNPRQSDWTEVKRVMRYLSGTIDMKLKLGTTNDDDMLIGYADADWAGEKQDRKSNSGHLFKFNQATIHWRCKKQDTVSLSSTEAEFISLSEACKEAVYLQGVLRDFNIDPIKTVMFEDNQSCLKLLEDGKFNDRTKHIDTKYHFVRDLKLKQKMDFQYCPTEEMLADFLTKPLNGVKLKQMLGKIGMEN